MVMKFPSEVTKHAIKMMLRGAQKGAKDSLEAAGPTAKDGSRKSAEELYREDVRSYDRSRIATEVLNELDRKYGKNSYNRDAVVEQTFSDYNDAFKEQEIKYNNDAARLYDESFIEKTLEKISKDIESGKHNLECFPAGTLISLPDSSETPIESLRIGDIVLAFDGEAESGRGALVPKKVARLFRNVTEEWIKLTWTDDGSTHELVATPGHVFLTPAGGFAKIGDMIAEDGSAEIVLADGCVTRVSATRIVYSADTTHLFEQGEEILYAAAGGTALASPPAYGRHRALLPMDSRLTVCENPIVSTIICVRHSDILIFLESAPCRVYSKYEFFI